MNSIIEWNCENDDRRLFQGMQKWYRRKTVLRGIAITPQTTGTDLKTLKDMRRLDSSTARIAIQEDLGFSQLVSPEVSENPRAQKI
jgi:hypothetical protein